MKKLKTGKTSLTPDDILAYIKVYESDQVPKFDDLWKYYLGKNSAILAKKSPDPNNPDNRTPVPYARKIITTFTGYAYRPRYITYKSENEAYLKELQLCFDENNEHIKTSLHGRNTGIFGVSYELLYIGESRRTGKPEVRFALIDPREMILIYSDDIEPEKRFAIRFYPVDDEKKNWKVYVYSAGDTTEYDMRREKWGEAASLMFRSRTANMFGDIPVVAYYLGDECTSLIEPVKALIDDYDELTSGSINEFNRYASAYLRIVGMSLTDQVKSASPNMVKSALQLLSRRRVFEQLKNKDDVTFLTKDIPTDYIKFMSELIKEQIHIQSHVPDLGSSAFKDGVSGVAVQRLMFDFENVVSNAEAEFDTGLLDRIALITRVFETLGRSNGGTFADVTISHKRNAPLNLKEFADTALTMQQAGFSRYLVADVMPDDILPDVEEELKRQDYDAEIAMPDVDNIPDPNADDQSNDLEEANAAETR